MRLRKKYWARPELEASHIVRTDQYDHKGNWSEEFKNKNDIHLELGCGKGSFIAEKSRQNDNINFVGIDLKDEVLVFALRKVIEVRAVKAEQNINVRLMPLNIMFIDDVFAKDEISRIYINFCNPWPKERHNKRRLTHTKFLTNYKKFLKVGSEVWFKTDDTGLFEDSIEYFKQCGFEILFLTYDLHKSGFEENVITEYEAKFASIGKKAMFLRAKLNKEN
ncbi:tRNA (guanosine(46)-N7)-methyltransferase TrmB [Clostridium estertheticum]|uniref:tRNA (guanine-N(7)-)-methyltransferase n=1 Tax=Clostridium estertheticum subsp. estertheticum TaxID=1552 RepID=A0A1J0GKZ8_9CLOT|nr:tRNA (guanosine(46)-N7)-methyltransferase TrmB [Clostridium estertheticum]APC42017.1 tRNA (guanosine(46)-N7)-methyltransferase TrmB [Clostridium estertheticum subsp. estertheticum]MBU3184022.1 tRNA (guanosine(46)-N7)-methyltransferase TrmB [Clostridium estertheticum]MBZ9616076.1 tRNA (guanosine(46)-N7)-methyltransferase TrmB [Clostridium estertheticum subsp. laramiense]WAG71827.1 tRNA (guanosine(46)-N7)-methyltransferase TrmB [Clostridium estertheticum]